MEIDPLYDELFNKIKDSFLSLEGGEELANTIGKNLESLYFNPPLEEIDDVIRRKLGIETVREMLFFPNQKHYGFYPLLCQEIPSSFQQDDQKNHPLAKTCPISITLMYLVHMDSLQFKINFIIFGGLHSLAHHLSHSNLYLRGQVMEIMLKIISFQEEEEGNEGENGGIDWFEPLKKEEEEDLEIMNSSDYRITPSERSRLYRELFSLSTSPTFINSLSSNASNPFPNSSFLSLQILAFYLSWVRCLYGGQRGELFSISSSLLEILENWSSNQNNNSPPSPSHQKRNKEETNLRDQMVKDFKLFVRNEEEENYQSKQEEEQFIKIHSSPINRSATSTNSSNDEDLDEQEEKKEEMEMKNTSMDEEMIQSFVEELEMEDEDLRKNEEEDDEVLVIGDVEIEQQKKKIGTDDVSKQLSELEEENEEDQASLFSDLDLEEVKIKKRAFILSKLQRRGGGDSEGFDRNNDEILPTLIPSPTSSSSSCHSSNIDPLSSLNISKKLKKKATKKSKKKKKKKNGSSKGGVMIDGLGFIERN